MRWEEWRCEERGEVVWVLAVVEVVEVEGGGWCWEVEEEEDVMVLEVKIGIGSEEDVPAERGAERVNVLELTSSYTLVIHSIIHSVIKFSPCAFPIPAFESTSISFITSSGFSLIASLPLPPLCCCSRPPSPLLASPSFSHELSFLSFLTPLEVPLEDLLVALLLLRLDLLLAELSLRVRLVPLVIVAIVEFAELVAAAALLPLPLLSLLDSFFVADRSLEDPAEELRRERRGCGSVFTIGIDGHEIRRRSGGTVGPLLGGEVGGGSGMGEM